MRQTPNVTYMTTHGLIIRLVASDECIANFQVRDLTHSVLSKSFIRKNHLTSREREREREIEREWSEIRRRLGEKETETAHSTQHQVNEINHTQRHSLARVE